MANTKSFYGRDLPESLVDYRSNESKSRLVRSLSAGTAVPFLSLSSCFNTQAEPAYCGLSTLAIILNALRIDPQRLWKTPWRWFSEELLDCCRPLEVVKKVGVTLEEFQCLARCNGALCRLIRPNDNDEDYKMFAKAVYCSCTAGKNLQCQSKDTSCGIKASEEENPDTFIAISYDRKTLKQTGSGHFSPIAAYDEESDSVLVLDTARFKYPPYWVSLHLLFQSMFPIDEATGKSRGYFLLRASNKEFQGTPVGCVWRELNHENEDGKQNGLDEPHAVYKLNKYCNQNCMQLQDHTE